MRESTLCLLVQGEPVEQVLLGFKKRGFGQDACQWLPLILADKSICATFIFNNDNETLQDYSITVASAS